MDSIPLRHEHVAGAKLFADRHDMIRGLGLPTGAVIAEIGVEYGNFSERLIDTLRPSQFWAFDVFDLHTIPGRPHARVLGADTHDGYYRKRIGKRTDTDVRVVVGDSSTKLAQIPDSFFDMIYVDGDHRLQGVINDAKQSVRAVKPQGILIFNDYIMFDHIANMPYGVVPVVNDLCVNHGWEVIAFAFQSGMFCDIALKRRDTGR